MSRSLLPFVAFVVLILAPVAAAAPAHVAAYHVVPGGTVTLTLEAERMDLAFNDGITSEGGGIQYTFPSPVTSNWPLDNATMSLKQRTVHSAWVAVLGLGGNDTFESNVVPGSKDLNESVWQDSDYIGEQMWVMDTRGDASATLPERLVVTGDFRISIWGMFGTAEGDGALTEGVEVNTGQRGVLWNSGIYVCNQATQAFATVLNGTLTLEVVGADQTHGRVVIVPDDDVQEEPVVVVPENKMVEQEGAGEEVPKADVGASEQTPDAQAVGELPAAAWSGAWVLAGLLLGAGVVGVGLTILWFNADRIARRAVEKERYRLAGTFAFVWRLRSAKDGRAWFVSGQAAAGCGAFGKAMAQHKVAGRLLARPSDMATNAFEAARAAASAGRLGVAAGWLDDAMAGSPSMVWEAQATREFQSCWGAPEFQDLVRRYGVSGGV